MTTVSPNAAPCDRACLEAWIDRYLAALVARDPDPLPLHPGCKFTENGQRLELGDGQIDGLWNTASGLGSYKLYLSDPEAGQAAFIGTIRENDTPALLALRLKIEDGRIAEIETIVARDEQAAGWVEALGSPHPVFLETVPPAERASRQSLIEISNLYFSGLERSDGRGVFPFTDDCNRIENGSQTTNKPSQSERPFDLTALSCKEQFELGFFRFVTRIRDRRFLVVDPERGLALAFVFFDHAGNVPTVTLTNSQTIQIGVKRPWTWEIAELFKVEKGLIRQIEVVSRECPYGMNSGWSSWEDGLSSRARWPAPGSRT